MPSALRRSSAARASLIVRPNFERYPPEDFQRPDPFIPDSIGHHQEWIKACKTGGPTTCNFDYSGALAEAALLCNVALRTGKRLTWDPKGLKATNCPQADALRFNHFIEAEVRRIPEQYWWIHRRFKGLSADYPNYYGAAARG